MQLQNRNTVPLFISGCVCLLILLAICLGVLNDANWVTTFDSYWIDYVQAYISPGLTTFIELFTELGNMRLVITLTILICLMLFYKKRYVDGLWFGGTILFGAAVITKFLKEYFNRERPMINQLVEKSGESFPSGHATATTVFYTLIGLIIIFLVTKLSHKILIGFVTLLFVFLILLTRIYLGVHYPTDVIAGFFLGVSAVLLSFGLYFILRSNVVSLLKRFGLKDKSIPKRLTGSRTQNRRYRSF